jgi:transposase
LSARAREQREAVRMQAAAWFAEGFSPPEVARRLRISNNSGYLWRRGWRSGGVDALVSKGPGGCRCRLLSSQLDRLRAALEAGPAVYGWSDQRWTLARIAMLIGRLFHVRYTLRGTSYLLHRIGFSPQMPARRAAERDEKAIAAWRTESWARVRG